MSDGLQWELGAVGLVVTLIGGIVGRDRWMLKQIRDGDEAVKQSVKEGDAELHSRINRTRDDYVRRDDLMTHIERIEGNLREMRAEIHNGNQDLLRIITTKDGGHP